MKPKAGRQGRHDGHADQLRFMNLVALAIPRIKVPSLAKDRNGSRELGSLCFKV